MNKQFEFFDLLESIAEKYASTKDVPYTACYASTNMTTLKPSKWFNSKHKVKDYIDYRTILWNEIVFDIDEPTTPGLQNITQGIYDDAYRFVQHLKNLKVPHYVFASGGKGVHISVFIDANGLQNEIEWRLIRAAVAMKLTQGIALMYDLSRILFSDLSNGALIRAEGGRKFHSHSVWRYKTYIPNFKPHPIVVSKFSDVNYPEEIKLYKLDEATVQYLRSLPVIEIEEDEIACDEVPQTPSKLPKKIVELIAKAKEGIHLRHIERFAIVTHMYRRGYSAEQIHKVFIHQPDYNPKITDYQIRHIISHGYRPISLTVLNVV